MARTGTGQTVLVAEDDALLRDLLHDVLVEQGFRVRTARDGAEAYAATSRTSIDLVLADLDMPYVDGLKLCRLLHRRVATRDVPLVLMSGMIGAGTALPAPADAFLAKPFTLDELDATVREVLRRP